MCRKRRSSANTIGQFSVERASLNRYLATRAPAKHVLRNVQAVEIEDEWNNYEGTDPVHRPTAIKPSLKAR